MSSTLSFKVKVEGESSKFFRSLWLIHAINWKKQTDGSGNFVSAFTLYHSIENKAPHYNKATMNHENNDDAPHQTKVIIIGISYCLFLTWMVPFVSFPTPYHFDIFQPPS